MMGYFDTFSLILHAFSAMPAAFRLPRPIIMPALSCFSLPLDVD